MIGKGMTVSEAAHRWVQEFNALPQGMIATLMEAKPCDWHEVTMPAECDRVYVTNMPDVDADGNEFEADDCEGKIIEIRDNEFCPYLVELENGTIIELEADDMEVEYDDNLPMWGTMWSFGDNCDDWWLSDGDGIKIMSECGFRVYENDEWGYFFGIDGAGYDFYEAHWIPAYRRRGLQWHDPATEVTANG